MTDDASAAQINAANPAQSTWLSANAGSGKTRVLTSRVARLLLAGTDPRNILCLTYTKAAASEMQNRLFKTLGSWAMLSDSDLRDALSGLGELPPDDLSMARTLFARAIEAPGGLRIQTIHALCASILRQFPLEGGVSPQFTELDDTAMSDLIDDVMDQLAARETGNLAELALFFSGDSLSSLATHVARHADRFQTNRSKAEIYALFDVASDRTLDHVVADALPPGDLAFLQTFAAALAESDMSTDLKLAQTLVALPIETPLQCLKVLEGPFLYGADTKAPFCARTDRTPTKGGRSLPSVAPVLDRFHDIMRQVEEARRTRIALVAAERANALHRFADDFLPSYEAAKQARAVLDFDDLIRRTRNMLSGPVLSWVLYRLDGRIDHILVDEAQDTSPAQWEIVQALTAAIADDPDRNRTLFVVGDKKQSIYSFQGADAEQFDSKKREFGDNLAGRLEGHELRYSFRSSPAILKLVDAVCEPLDGLGDTVSHAAFRTDMPGRVDLLPLVRQPEEIEDPDWFDPVDRPVDNAAPVILGEDIAALIDGLLKTETIKGENGVVRPVRAGDIMVLVQRRSAIFDQIIQSCKALDLPVAGSDRLKISGELAVRDLLALLSFLALPEDDLSLAAALRSPLFGWSEQKLFTLASGRKKKTLLWAELRRRREEFPETFEMLDSLRGMVDFLRPYELLERILGRFGGRRKLLARLGPEAADGIDELLSQAILFERDNVPSVTRFLSRTTSEDIEIKRPADADDNLIRVMTVHGAKGLERPIVILPDTTGTGRSGSDSVILDEDGMPMMSLSKEESPERILAAKEAIKTADREERNRLLYVAMTRAESWLIVAGVEQKKDSKTVLNWHAAIEDGMKRAGATSGGLAVDGLRLEHGVWPTTINIENPESDTPAATLPDYFERPASSSRPTEKTIAPSSLGGDKVLGGGAYDEDTAKRRGRQIHTLLEHLPGRDDQAGLAERLLSRGADRAEPDEIPELLAQAQRALTLHPDLFCDDALAEVDISTVWPRFDARMAGKIDRLLVTDTDVLAVDFKTNAIVPDRPEDTPDGLLRQMGAYLEALEQIYTDRPVRVAILWTETGALMELPRGIVRDALASATIS